MSGFYMGAVDVLRDHASKRGFERGHTSKGVPINILFPRCLGFR